ncbi:DUF2536 family protein [Xanthomonas citri pv. citri]|nr:DUF2536 family protein [Xanthomonas citri pv. citri]
MAEGRILYSAVVHFSAEA